MISAWERDGQLYMIEINPNSGILFKPEDLGPADVMMEYDAEGHAGFLDRIFRAAVIRNKAHNKVDNKAGMPTAKSNLR